MTPEEPSPSPLAVETASEIEGEWPLRPDLLRELLERRFAQARAEERERLAKWCDDKAEEARLAFERLGDVFNGFPNRTTRRSWMWKDKMTNAQELAKEIREMKP